MNRSIGLFLAKKKYLEYALDRSIVVIVPRYISHGTEEPLACNRHLVSPYVCRDTHAASSGRNGNTAMSFVT